MTAVNDGFLKMDDALKFSNLLLQVGMVQTFTINTSMDCLVVLSKLVVVTNNHLLNAISHHLELHTIPFILAIDLDDL